MHDPITSLKTAQSVIDHGPKKIVFDMHLRPDSSAVSDVFYSVNDQVLRVVWKRDGSIGTWQDVPVGVATDIFHGTNSVGAAINLVKGHYAALPEDRYQFETTWIVKEHIRQLEESNAN